MMKTKTLELSFVYQRDQRFQSGSVVFQDLLNFAVVIYLKRNTSLVINKKK